MTSVRKECDNDTLWFAVHKLRLLMRIKGDMCLVTCPCGLEARGKQTQGRDKVFISERQ
jgi:hypothetical protein